VRKSCRIYIALTDINLIHNKKEQTQNCPDNASVDAVEEEK